MTTEGAETQAQTSEEELATITAFANTVSGAMEMDGATPEATTAAPSGAERYDPQRDIGEGGMGRVIEAIDRQFGRRVAVKELLRSGSAALRGRFHVESVVTANLEHPGVAPSTNAASTTAVDLSIRCGSFVDAPSARPSTKQRICPHV